MASHPRPTAVHLLPVTLSPRLEAKILASASASKFWTRPRGFGLVLASISLSYYVIGYSSCKNCVKFRNFVNFSRNNLKSYVVNHYLLLFHNYFWPRPRPQSSGLGLKALASASRFWPRLTSLLVTPGAVWTQGEGCQMPAALHCTHDSLGWGLVNVEFIHSIQVRYDVKYKNLMGGHTTLFNFKTSLIE